MSRCISNFNGLILLCPTSSVTMRFRSTIAPQNCRSRNQIKIITPSPGYALGFANVTLTNKIIHVQFWLGVTQIFRDKVDYATKPRVKISFLLPFFAAISITYIIQNMCWAGPRAYRLYCMLHIRNCNKTCTVSDGI